MVDASRVTDITDLEQRIMQLNEDGQRWLAANSVLRDLMIEPTLTEMIGLLSQSQNLPQHAVDQGVMMAFQILPLEETERFINSLCNHLVDGTDDAPNSTAVGGFNQTELEALNELVDLAERTYDKD